MTYYLYKFKFITPVRFGIDKASSNLTTSAFTANADTFFSALCNECIKIYGLEGLNLLKNKADTGEFLISDLLPYKNVTDENGNVSDCNIYIPKPAIVVEKKNVKSDAGELSSVKKKLKNISHIDITKVDKYINYLRGEDEMDFAMDPSMIYMESNTVKVFKTYSDEPMPYQVASVGFLDNAGLALIVKLDDEYKETFDNIIDSLSYTGIGGKRSSGYGKFILDEDELEISEEYPIYDSDMLIAKTLGKNGDVNVSISSILPNERDMDVILDENSFYQLIFRKGFIYSESYTDNFLKKKQLAMIKSGACFPNHLEGTIGNVGVEGTHEIYRYGKGMFLGVSI